MDETLERERGMAACAWTILMPVERFATIFTFRDIFYRYKDDGAIAKKMPAVSEASQLIDSDDEENMDGLAVSKRRLLRKDNGVGMLDPVLSTLSVNKDLG